MTGFLQAGGEKTWKTPRSFETSGSRDPWPSTVPAGPLGVSSPAGPDDGLRGSWLHLQLRERLQGGHLVRTSRTEKRDTGEGWTSPEMDHPPFFSDLF